MGKLRVLVVEDSLTIRQRLREVLASDPELELVGDVEDGKRAIELCRELRPDVVSLDMMLPVMSGLAATEYIMAHCPTPILIVSSSINRGELFKTYDALAAGAVDVLEKPRGDEMDGQWERRYLSAIKLVARIKVITHPRARLGALGQPARTIQLAPPPVAGQTYRVAALGASTGGPAALVEVLRAIPKSLPIPVLLLLHIDEPFGLAFAEWLDAQTPHRVAYARDGDGLGGFAGKILMAPPGRHLVVRGGRLHLTSDPERHSCRPSIDVLFESLAREYGAATIACLLTGMGRDGAAGLLEVKRAGGLTIAQDEATSVVYGMPREAVLLGAADRVLPLPEIGGAVAELAGRRDGGRR
jgi:two-component system, chemotaxis family, protein-glutamate methylesterase/glutaminase